MPLDVETPPPPSLESSVDADEYEDVTVQGENYRRDELEDLLAKGAWDDAFQQWAATTSMEPGTWEIVLDLDLLAEFDFFWDSFAGRVGYHAPGLPEDWREREIHPDIDSWGQVSSINAGLTEFGQVVCEVLAEEYIDWEADYEGPDDLPDF